MVYLPSAVLDVLGLPYVGSRTESFFLTTHKAWPSNKCDRPACPRPSGWKAGERSRTNRQARATKAVRNCFSPTGNDLLAPLRVLRGSLRAFGTKARAAWTTTRCCGTSIRPKCGSVWPSGPRASGPPLFRRTVHRRAGSSTSRVLAGKRPAPFAAAGQRCLPPAEIDFSAFPPGKPRIVGHRAKWQADSFEYHHTPRRFDFPPSDGPLLDQLAIWPSSAGRCLGSAAGSGSIFASMRPASRGSWRSTPTRASRPTPVLPPRCRGRHPLRRGNPPYSGRFVVPLQIGRTNFLWLEW